MIELTGKHVFAMFALAFGTIIAVNLTLAFNAVRTFPGLEVKNSYVASQAFDAQRAAQTRLGWSVSAKLSGTELVLRFDTKNGPVRPMIESATFGRATHVESDQIPEFEYKDGSFVAPVVAGEGNWNLRVVARAKNGTQFQQRIVVEVAQ